MIISLTMFILSIVIKLSPIWNLFIALYSYKINMLELFNCNIVTKIMGTKT